MTAVKHAADVNHLLKALSRADAPPTFVRRFQPVTADHRERGAARFCFDALGLAFYRRMATADAVAAGSIWSVVADADASRFHLVAGSDPNAVAYFVTQIPFHESAPRCWALPKRQTLRQRIRRTTLESLLDELRQAAFHVPPGVLALVEAAIDGGRTDRP